MEPGLFLFVSLLGLMSFGILWFHVVRPILESFGLISFGSMEPYTDQPVKHLPSPALPRYVEPRPVPPVPVPVPVPVPGGTEMERVERADVRDITYSAPSRAPGQTVYTPKQVGQLTDQAYDEGAADALGKLMKTGLVAADHEAAAMELLFGPRGRRHQRIRSRVKSAMATTEAPEMARLVSIRDGKEGVIEL